MKFSQSEMYGVSFEEMVFQNEQNARTKISLRDRQFTALAEWVTALGGGGWCAPQFEHRTQRNPDIIQSGFTKFV